MQQIVLKTKVRTTIKLDFSFESQQIVEVVSIIFQPKHPFNQPFKNLKMDRNN